MDLDTRANDPLSESVQFRRQLFVGEDFLRHS